jgi:predicted HAD superfamily Cof-like phosphohydrolase
MRFNEPNALNDVARFHETFDLPIPNIPLVPSIERCQLRIALLQEELNEFKEALANDDLIEAADALADLQYVLSGAILELGLGEKFKSLFDEVQRSNMSKTCKTIEEAKKTQEFYLDNKDTESFIVKKGDEFLVYRTEDKKVLKSINYSPADLKSILS